MLVNFSDLLSREAALDFGNKLLDLGLFRHCSESNRRLLDGYYFYRLYSEYAPPRSNASRGWFSGRRDTRGAPQATTAPLPPDKDGEASRATGTEKGPTSRTRVEMTRSIIIDLDPSKKSDRAETVSICLFSASPAAVSSAHTCSLTGDSALRFRSQSCVRISIFVKHFIVCVYLSTSPALPVLATISNGCK